MADYQGFRTAALLAGRSVDRITPDAGAAFLGPLHARHFHSRTSAAGQIARYSRSSGNPRMHVCMSAPRSMALNSKNRVRICRRRKAHCNVSNAVVLPRLSLAGLTPYTSSIAPTLYSTSKSRTTRKESGVWCRQKLGFRVPGRDNDREKEK